MVIFYHLRSCLSISARRKFKFDLSALKREKGVKRLSRLGDKALYQRCFFVFKKRACIFKGNYLFANNVSKAEFTSVFTVIGTAVAKACTIFSSEYPQRSCAYLSTAGNTPHAPQVGAVTIVPPEAFSSLTANAYEQTILSSRVSSSSSGASPS